MAKPPPVEFFEVTVRCPKEMLGDLMADISKRGLSDVKFEHVTAVKTFSRNTAATGSDPSIGSHDFLRAWIKDHPTFKAIDAVNAFKADGRGEGTSAYHSLTALVGEGLLKKMGGGGYSRADVKALAAPKKAKKASRKGIKHHDIPNADFILRAMSRNHGKMSSATIKKHFEEAGRVPSGVGPTINKLRVDGMLKQLGDGMYELTARAAKPKTNSGAAVAETSPGV